MKKNWFTSLLRLDLRSVCHTKVVLFYFVSRGGAVVLFFSMDLSYIYPTLTQLLILAIFDCDNVGEGYFGLFQSDISKSGTVYLNHNSIGRKSMI